MTERHRIYLVWLASGLLIAAFHEPWRDEAQAWLVARHASGLRELLFRSSAEATGPLYYLLLWPWARLLPGAFPTVIFLVSWAGTALAVRLLLFTELVPLRYGAMVAMGYLFGYEYAVVARLYGWGSFLLLAGILWDKRGRGYLAALCLSAACLVQLNFVFAAGMWCAYRVLSGNGVKRYLPVALAAGLAYLHLRYGDAARPWHEWREATSLTHWGGTLIAPFVQTPGPIGWGGLILFPLVLLPLDRAGLAALAFGMAPFCFLFLMRYGGWAWSRHGGGLFLVWLVVAISRDVPRRRPILFLLWLSLLTGLAGRGMELLEPNSDGMRAAGKVREAAAGMPIRIVTHDKQYAFVVAARLDREIWFPGGKIGCPFSSDSCFAPPVPSVPACDVGEACFFLRDRRQDPAKWLAAWGGSWELLQEGRKTLSHEDVTVYRWRP